jgi:hypothetical protein
MGQKAKPGELRALLKLAKRLRDGALETDDRSYSDLFLKGAAALEERAKVLAFSSLALTPRTGHWPRVKMDTLN